MLLEHVGICWVYVTQIGALMSVFGKDGLRIFDTTVLGGTQVFEVLALYC